MVRHSVSSNARVLVFSRVSAEPSATSGTMAARRSSAKRAAATGSLANSGSLFSHAPSVVSFAIRSNARANDPGNGPSRYSRKSSSLRRFCAVVWRS